VTTSSLDALRLYAEAERATLARDHASAARHVAAAIDADPNFAMAHRWAGIIAINELRFGDAVAHMTRAWELRDRLTDRERWHAEAHYHSHVTLLPQRAADAFEMLLARYPDEHRAAINLASTVLTWHNDLAGAAAALARVPPDGRDSWVYHAHRINITFAEGRLAAADSAALEAEAAGLHEVVTPWRSGRAFATGDLATATELCAAAFAATPPRVGDRWVGPS
jgi:hypothetical protein